MAEEIKQVEKTAETKISEDNKLINQKTKLESAPKDNELIKGRTR